MTKSNFAFVAAVFGIFVFFGGCNKSSETASQNETSSPKVDPQIQELARDDHAALKDSRAPDSFIFGAMIRLAQQKDALAHSAAIDHKNDAHALVRQGAATALGYFDDQTSTDALFSLVDDVEPLVKNAAIRSLGTSQVAVRSAKIDSLLLSTYDETARIALLSAKYGAATKSEGKQKALQDLIAMASKSKNLSTAQIAATSAATLAPSSPLVVEMYRKALTAKNTNLIPAAIRHLSAIHDGPGIETMIPFATDPNSEIRRSLLQSLSLSCSRKRWLVIEDRVYNEPDPTLVKLSYQALLSMRGPEAQALVDRLSQERKFSPDKQKDIAALKGQLASRQEPALCATAANISNSAR